MAPLFLEAAKMQVTVEPISSNAGHGSSGYAITVTPPVRSIPSPYALRFLLPGRFRRSIRSWHRWETLPCQILPAEISDAILSYLTGINVPATSQIDAAGFSSDAFFTFGDTMYRLVPERQVSISRALRTLRERATLAARAQSAKLVETARAEERTIRETIEQQRAAWRAERQTTFVAPRWATYLPIWRRADEHYLILVPETLVLKAFTFTARDVDYRWDVLPDTKPIPLSIWICLGLEDHRVIWGSCCVPTLPTPQLLPHMNDNGACIEVGTEHGPITSLEQLRQVGHAIMRAFSVVNLLSLLVGQIRYWHVGVIRACPPALLRALISGLFFESDNTHDYYESLGGNGNRNPEPSGDWELDQPTGE